MPTLAIDPPAGTSFTVAPPSPESWSAFDDLVDAGASLEVAIRGAVDLKSAAGGGVVEGCPHDLTHQTKTVSSSLLHKGTRRLYERLGVTHVRPKSLKNCVMSMAAPAAGRA